MVPQKDPLGILGEQPKEKKQADPLGILKKKEDSEADLEIGGEGGTSVPRLDSEKTPKGFEGLKPAKVQPTLVEQPSVGEDTVLTKKLAKAQKPAIATTEVRLPAAPKVIAEEEAAERALAPKIEKPLEDVDETQGFLNAIDRGVLQGKLADMMALGQMPKREELKEIARINKQMASIPSTGAYERFSSAPDLKTSLKEFVKNPFEITSQLVGESLAAQIRHGYSRVGTGVATGAALGSVLPGIGTAAGAGTGFIAGMGVAGYNLEMASSIMQSFQDAGVDITDEKSLTKAFDDPATLRKAREFANKRAVPITLFDMFSAGMGGKLLNKPVKTMLGKVGRVAKEVGVQMGLAGAGETAAQVVSGQKINPTAIFSEMIGEAGGGAPDIVVGNMIEKKKAGQSIKKEAVQLDLKPEQLQDMLDISEAAGEITDTQADEIKKEVEGVQKIKQAIPEQYRKNSDIVEALEQKRQLEAQKQGLDPVFARKIDEQIKALDTKIDDITAGEVAPEAVPAEEKYRVEYFDPVKQEMTHSFFDTKEEGDRFTSSLTDRQKSKGVQAYFQKTTEPSLKVGEVAPKAAPQVPTAPVKISKEVEPFIKIAPNEYSDGIETKYIVPTSNSELGGYIEVSKEVYDEWKKLDEEEKIAVRSSQRILIPEQRSKSVKGDYMRYAAEKRKVLGTITSKELASQTEKQLKLAVGDTAKINDTEYTISGFPFGRIKLKIKSESGTGEITVSRGSEIEKKILAQKPKIEVKEKGALFQNIDEYLSGLSKAKEAEVPAAPEKTEEINAEDLRKNPNIKLDFTVGYPESFASLGTDRATIAKENNVDASSIKIGDEVVVNNKKYVVETFPFAEKVLLIRIDENGKLLRNKDLKAEQIYLADEEEELPFGETAPREEKKQKEITNKTKRALNIEIVDNPRGEVLQYFLAGGKVSPESMEELFGRKKQGYRWTGDESKIKEERKLRRPLIEKNAPAIEALAEKIAGTDRLDRVQEYRNAIEEVLLDHNRRETMADELVDDFDVEYAEKMKQQELDELGKAAEEEAKYIASLVPETQRQEIIKVLDRFRKEDGKIDWDEMESKLEDGFEPVLLELSEQSQKFINDAIEQIKTTGRISGVPIEAVPTAEAEGRAGDAARKLAERIRAGKISKEGFRASTGFDVVFDAALEVVATSLEAGASIADAIESGLNYIRGTEYYKNLTDKKAFEDKFSNKLNEEYAIQESTAGEVPVQPEAGVSEEVEAGVPPTRPQKPAKEGEAEGETAAEKKSAELSLKGINEIANEFSLDPVEGRLRKSDIELREEAKNQIDKWVAEGSYDSKIEGLVEKAEDYQVLNDKDRVILEQHLAGVRDRFSSAIESGGIKAGSKEYNARLKELKRLIDAGAKTRSAAGAALRIPSGGSVAHPLENYDTALVAKMEANNVDELTPEQIKEVEDSVKEYKQKVEEANNRIKDLEDKLSELMAQNEVGIAKKRRVVKSKEERIGERKKAIADAREALKRLRTGEAGLSAVPLPYVREFVAISPYVKKIMQSYVEEGIDNLNLIIDKLYEDFKDVVPGITRKDLRDIVGNQYSERKQTKSELKSAIKDLTEEAKLLSLYEKLLAGEEPASPKKKVERNQKIKELRDKINEIRKRNREADVDYTDLKRIEDTKKRAVAKTEEYKRRIEEGDFAPSEKPISIFNDTNLQRKYPKEYADMLDAVQEKEDAKHEFDIALLKDEERNMTAVQKTFRTGKLIVGTIKAIKSGIDASGALIQNFAPLTSYPSSWFKAFFNSWSDFASEKKFNRWHTQLKNNKAVWDLIEKSGLQITQPSALKEAQREEVFSNNALDKSFKIGDKTYNIGKYTTKPFERLFTSMGNALRVDVFLKIAEKWYEEGKTFESNPEDYKSLANMLNTMTGRGKLAPAVQKASDIIGGAIWSPQLMASRFNILGISDAVVPVFGRKGYYAGLSPEVRKMQIKNTAQMIGAGLALMSLASISGADEVDFDPESPTFGTIRIGNKRIPVFSNFTKYVKAVVQFATGKQKIEGERVEKRREQTVYKFFRSSVPPSTGLIVDAITGVDYSGQPVTAEGMIRGTIVPISIESIGKELKRDGALGAATGLGQFFGLNITDERDYVKREDRPFEVKDPVTFKKRETTPRELEAFKKRRDEIYKEISSDYEKNYETVYLTQDGKIKLSRPSSVSDEEFDSWKELYYRELNKEQAKEMYKLIMSKAKRKAKSDLQLEAVEEKEDE